MNYSPIASGSYGCVFLPGLRDNNNNRPKSNILSKVLKKKDADDELNELNNIMLYSNDNTFLKRKVKQGIFVLPENNVAMQLGKLDTNDLENFDKICENVLEVSSKEINSKLNNFRKIDYKNKGVSLDKVLPTLVKSDNSLNKSKIDVFFKSLNNLLDNIVTMNKQGLIHYDIKPANLVTNSSQPSSISIIDWGFSRIYSIPSSTSDNVKITKKYKIKFLENYFNLKLSDTNHIQKMYEYYGIPNTNKTDNSSINEMYNILNNILPQYAWMINTPYSSCLFSTAFPYDDNSQISLRTMTNNFTKVYPQTIFNIICQQFKFQIQYKYNEIHIFSQVENLKLFIEYVPDFKPKYSFKIQDNDLLKQQNSNYIELLANITTDYIYSIINNDFIENKYFKDVYMYNVDIWGALTILFDILDFFKSVNLQKQIPGEILNVIELVYFSSTYSNSIIDIKKIQGLLTCINKTTKFCKQLREEDTLDDPNIKEGEEEDFFDTLDNPIINFKDELYSKFVKYKQNFYKFLATIQKPKTKVKCLQLFIDFVNWFIEYIEDMSSYLQKIMNDISIQNIINSFKEAELIIQDQYNMLIENLIKERQYKFQKTIDNIVFNDLNDSINNLEQGELNIDDILNYVRDYIILKNYDRIPKKKITPINYKMEENELGFII